MTEINIKNGIYNNAAIHNDTFLCATKNYSKPVGNASKKYTFNITGDIPEKLTINVTVSGKYSRIDKSKFEVTNENRIVEFTVTGLEYRESYTNSSDMTRYCYYRYNVPFFMNLTRSVDEALVPEDLPSNNISFQLINEQLRRESNHSINLNEKLVRLLANKLTSNSIISTNNLKGKRLVEFRYPFQYGQQGGGYGSGTSYSSWSDYITPIKNFGLVYGLHVYLEVKPTSGNADAMGIEVEIRNKDFQDKKITLTAKYNGGGNSTSTYRLDRDLTEDEIQTLGGYNSRLEARFRIHVNTGNSTLYIICKAILTPLSPYEEA